MRHERLLARLSRVNTQNSPTIASQWLRPRVDRKTRLALMGELFPHTSDASIAA